MSNSILCMAGFGETKIQPSFPEHEMWRLSSPCLGPVTSLVT